MKTSKHDTVNIDSLFKDSAKAVKIYELILDKNNLDKILPFQIESPELNDINCAEFNEYIKRIGNKEDKTNEEINDFTSAFANVLYVLINDIVDDLEVYKEIKNYDNLFKLSCYYYLFKIITGNNNYEDYYYMDKIDAVVEKIVSNKECYYKLLIHLGEFKEDVMEKNKNEIIEAYFKILFFLNEKNFLEKLTEYIDNKKQSFKQYNIPLPPISFSIKGLVKNLERVYNILFILERTENFKTNERFEYFNCFRNKHELLGEINYILVKMDKNPLVSLDKISDDIGNEAIKYSLDHTELNSGNDDYISELEQIAENAKKKKEEYKIKYDLMIQKYNKLNKKYNECNKKFNSLDLSYSKDINELQSKISYLKKKQVGNNTINNRQAIEISLLKTQLQKNKETIERISYREIGTRIIKFFSLSQPENKRKECIENNVSPTNIFIINEYIKKNLSNYYYFMKEQDIDLLYILTEIKEVKKAIIYWFTIDKKN